MRNLRFGRKISLPSTVAIKHQIGTAEYAEFRVKKAKAEARAEAAHRQLSLAVPIVAPATEMKPDNVPVPLFSIKGLLC
jgi:hypothetical protein